MREYNPNIVPAQGWEVAEWIVTEILSVDSNLQELLLGPGRIFAHRFTEPPPAQGEWARVLFREPVIPAIRMPSSTMIRQQPYDLLVEVANSDDPAWNPDRAAADVYTRCYQLIVGQKPILERGDVLLGFRSGSDPTALMSDAVNNCYYTNGTFRLVLQPVNA